MSLLKPEFVDNPENRCPVVLILDTSASMEGDPIDSLNQGLAEFKFDVEQDELAALRVELCIIGFGREVDVLQPFITVDDFTPPVLVTAGKTPLGSAIDRGLDALEERKKIYKANGVQYYRPWVFLVTDGAPTDGEKWKDAAARVSYLEANKRISFFTIAVEGADMEILERVAPISRPPIQLQDLKFKELFRWLSSSVRRVSTNRVGGDMIELPSVSGWAATGT